MPAILTWFRYHPSSISAMLQESSPSPISASPGRRSEHMNRMVFCWYDVLNMISYDIIWSLHAPYSPILPNLETEGHQIPAAQGFAPFIPKDALMAWAMAWAKRHRPYCWRQHFGPSYANLLVSHWAITVANISQPCPPNKFISSGYSVHLPQINKQQTNNLTQTFTRAPIRLSFISSTCIYLSWKPYKR